MGGKVRSIYGLVAASVAATAPAGGQSVQYGSAAGVEYRAQRDTGAIARAESALAADPQSVERIVQLGVAQSGARQFREAIQTFTRGLTIAPNDAVLYRWRGHRYLSVREFDRALDDLTRGSRLDSTNYGIWYHLGIVRYARGDFAAAADAFARAQRRPPDAAELAGATDWLWMSLSRAGRAAEAQAMLDRRPDSRAAANAHALPLPWSIHAALLAKLGVGLAAHEARVVVPVEDVEGLRAHAEPPDAAHRHTPGEAQVHGPVHVPPRRRRPDDPIGAVGHEVVGSVAVIVPVRADRRAVGPRSCQNRDGGQLQAKRQIADLRKDQAPALIRRRRLHDQPGAVVVVPETLELRLVRAQRPGHVEP